MGFTLFLLLPFLLQAAAIGFDELYFHVRRGLPRWERIGHPLDTLTMIASFAYLLIVPYSSINLKIYCAMAAFSCFFVTKDEFVHKEHCPASEQWLHAVLFLLHPIALAAAAVIWALVPALTFVLWGQLLCMSLFCIYQVVYWNFVRLHDQ